MQPANTAIVAPQAPPIGLSTWEDWAFPLIVFCLGVFFLTYIVRRVVEGYIPSFAARNQWQKVWLPSLPVIWGMIAAAIMHGYPYLKTLPTMGTRAMYGAVAGGVCNLVYKVLKAVLQARFGVKIGESEVPPAQLPGALPAINHDAPTPVPGEKKA